MATSPPTRQLASREESLSWQTQVDRDGLQGLRTTRIQEYRGRARRTSLHDARGAGPRSESGQRSQSRTAWLRGRASAYPRVTARARGRHKSIVRVERRKRI